MKKQIVWIVVGVLVITAVVLMARGDKEPEQIACTMDAMQCPDGSYVGRTGPKCEFVCPISTSTPLVSARGNVKVSAPVPNQSVGLPLVIKGEARVFENVFNYRVKDSDGTVLLESFAMANSPDIGQFGPFEVSVNYPKPKGTTGTVEVFVYSAKDGSEDEMVRIPVQFAAVDDMAVKVYFSDEKKDPSALRCETTYAFSRRISKTTAVARAALDELLKGPTAADASAGARTNINSGVRVNNVTIDSQGVARADFSDLLNAGVAGSCRVSAIRSQIENTLKQFSSVKSVVISVNGSTEDVLQP